MRFAAAEADPRRASGGSSDAGATSGSESESGSDSERKSVGILGHPGIDPKWVCGWCKEPIGSASYIGRLESGKEKVKSSHWNVMRSMHHKCTVKWRYQEKRTEAAAARKDEDEDEDEEDSNGGGYYLGPAGGRAYMMG